MTQKTFDKKLEKITETIAKQFHPDKIILFGSWAWGTPGPDSDVDLLVVKNTTNTRKTAREIDGALFPRPFPVDLIAYKPSQVERQNIKGDFFIRNILTRGKVLYAK